MLGFIVALSLLAVALLALALQRTYASLAPKELKRRARNKDPIADVLYRAVAYGASLRILLWIIVVLSAAASFVLLSNIAPSILAFLAVAAVISYGFIWMPAHHATRIGTEVAVRLTPLVTWLLTRLHPALDRLATFAQKHRPITMHTGLYDREDLLKLIELQKGQPDSRISADTLDLLSHSLMFGDRLVRDTMVPARIVRQVSAEEAVSPVMIRDLHDSGFSRFPVHGALSSGSKADKTAKPPASNIIGTLFLRDLVSLKHSGRVCDVMVADVYYVHEDYPLEQVLDAFIKTQHHLFVVVNSFEEFVGIITIEDILEQILGRKIVDEFDQYDDLRAVAAQQAKVEHTAKLKAHTESSPSSKRIGGQEVVMTASLEVMSSGNPYPAGTLKHIIYQAGFRANALEIAFAVAMGESGGKTTAHNGDASTGDDSYGLFQINMLGDMGPERRKLYDLTSDKDLFDPATNVRVAFELSKSGKDWQPWSVYTNGAYKKHYDPKADSPIKR